MPHVLENAQRNWRSVALSTALALGWTLATPPSPTSVSFAQDRANQAPDAADAPKTNVPGVETPTDSIRGDLKRDGDSPTPKTDLVKKIKKDLLAEARAIADPGERSLALQRVGASKQFTEDYEESLEAYLEAGQAASQVQDRLIHDLRLIAVIRGLISLSDEFRREAVAGDISALGSLTDSPEDDSKKGDEPPPPAPEADANANANASTGGDAGAAGEKKITVEDRMADLSKVETIANHAAQFASQLSRIGYRSEQRYRIAEELGAQTLDLFNELNKSDDAAAEGLAKNRDAMILKSDGLLRIAAQIAAQIERPIWRDRGLLTAAINAAGSKRFDLALEFARTIPASEPRAEALIRLADTMARHEGNEDKATAAFSEAARAVAAIPMEDLRKTMTWLLINALISDGRFEDARASVSLYNGEPQATANALGAVAEAQGRRGLGAEARRWIATIPDPGLQSMLRRRALDGELNAVNASRSQSGSGAGNGGDGAGLPNPGDSTANANSGGGSVR